MKICKVCGREVNKLKKGMCSRHYQQFKKYGSCLDNTYRSRFDENEIVFHDEYAEIVLYNKENLECARSIIDLGYVDKLKQYKWSLRGDGYCVNKIGLLHRVIMDCPEDMLIDHISRDKLDNRKSNLRICTKQQNNINKGIISKNTSGTTGVIWDKSRNKWRSQIKLNGKNRILGRFNNIEDAIKSRLEAEKEYFGEFAPQS